MKERFGEPLSCTPLAGARRSVAATVVSDDFPARVLSLVNGRREAAGVVRLSAHPALSAAAQGHAADMAARNYVAHRNPEGQSVGGRIDAAGYKRWVYAGENIGAGFASPDAIVEAWWNSAGHRRNMLDRDFLEAGAGVYFQADDAYGVVLWNGDVGGPYYWYWVLDLGRRVKPTFLPQVHVE